MSEKFDRRCPACGTYDITFMLEEGLSHHCTKCGYGWTKVKTESGIAILA